MTAFSLAVEIGDWDRFTGASIGAYLGLVPSEHSSGASRSQGPITKTGNSHVRRLLVEAAWHHRKTYRPGVVLRRRWECGHPGGPGSWTRRQPAAARPLGELRRTQETPGGRQRRRRAGDGRLVLVAGDPARLNPGPGPMNTPPALRVAGHHGGVLAARSSGLARRRQGRSSSAGPGPLTRPVPGLRALHLDPSSLTPPGQQSRTPPTLGAPSSTRQSPGRKP